MKKVLIAWAVIVLIGIACWGPDVQKDLKRKHPTVAHEVTQEAKERGW